MYKKLFKKISIILFVFLVITFVGCEKINNKSTVNKLINNINDINDVKVISNYSSDTTIEQMDTVIVGSFTQSDVNGNTKEPIEWIVLEKDDKNRKALLLSKYIIDCKDYNEENIAITWENSYIRKWLNNDFYNEGFSLEEKEFVLTTDIVNNDNTEYGTKGGNITSDKIFLLSIDEVKKYFAQQDMYAENKRLATKGTPYAKSVKNHNEKMIVIEGTGYYQGKEYDFMEYKDEWYYGNSNYWLRSPGRTSSDAARISADGIIVDAGRNVDIPVYGIRPAIYIKY